MIKDTQKRLIIHVADIALGDKRCDIEKIFSANNRS